MLSVRPEDLGSQQRRSRWSSFASGITSASTAVHRRFRRNARGVQRRPGRDHRHQRHTVTLRVIARAGLFPVASVDPSRYPREVAGSDFTNIGLTGGRLARARGEPGRTRREIIIPITWPGEASPRYADLKPRRWPSVVAEDDADRARFGRIVFGNDGERATLNAIVHPRVRELARARAAEAPSGSVIVHVIPLLFESEAWRTVDATVAVIAADEARIARVMQRDGLDRASILERMRAQIDPAEARRRATYTIDNDADLTTLRTRANAVYDKLISG